MSSPAASIPLSGLARRLVKDGLLSEVDANKALEQSRRKRLPLVAHLVTEKILTARTLAQVAAEEFGTPLFDLDALDREFIPTRLVDEKLIRQHQALPIFRRGNRLFVAMSDPMNVLALDEIKFNTGIPTEPVLVEQDKLAKLIEDTLNDASAMMEGLMAEDLDNLEIVDREERGQEATESDVDDTPVVRFVNKVLLDAINRKASDIHFEPYEKFFRVRFRLDGVLHDIAQPPTSLAPRITSRIKVMSRMDISERRIPQDGRIKMQISRGRAIDFRVNSCPTLYGEKVVLRILDSSSAFMGIDALGYEEHQKALYLKALSKPYGMILVTGPTGSGKTVSLYTGLGILNTPDRNISTAEDPAEINMPGINQVNVNPKVGLTFAAALRSFLRQDPDIIMVGEIRDLETAEIAIKAAQTGHLVLSTLHTNDAPQTLTRLANMGVPPYNIASSILLIIAQRLARRLCNHCKAPEEIPRETLLQEGFTEAEIDQGFRLFKPVGCDQCTNGYQGRVGIYQVLPISQATQRLILEGGNSMQLAEQARAEGVDDLRRAGLLKVKAGVTSLEEVNRVTKD
ncbi:type IV pilus assembly protein PilB [Ectothiorhodospira magna]|uniref:Type IV pilus assembly protein PilB n=1 Tax=Ectothiorhodospira magna TaxID=867345 RepID=A0A1H8Z8T5_9GAMM|nr:type IV-A pilus assembly ATPase PilB [Ectothiorhodospira magna]SEP60782.1 type IV pilus assembly protein PilB [Ectothiorhodospira magna]